MCSKTREPHPRGTVADNAPMMHTGEPNTTAPLYQLPMPVPAVCTRPLFHLKTKKKKTTKNTKKTNTEHKKQRKMGGGKRGDTTINSTRKPHIARAPVNRRQVGEDTAHAHAPRAAKGRDATVYTPRVGRTRVTQPAQRAHGRSGTPRPQVPARPGCIGNQGKLHPEPWKQLMTGVPAHTPGWGLLPSSGAPQLEPQG